MKGRSEDTAGEAVDSFIQEEAREGRDSRSRKGAPSGRSPDPEACCQVKEEAVICQASLSTGSCGWSSEAPRASHSAAHSPVPCQVQLRNSPGFPVLCPTSSLLPWVIVEDTEAHRR